MILHTSSTTSTASTHSPQSQVVEISSVSLREFSKQEIAVQSNWKVSLADFLKEFYSELKASTLGRPTRFDLTGSALVSLVEPGETVRDIDFAIDYPSDYTQKLSLVREILKKTLTQLGITFTIKPITLDEPDFKAVIFTFGNGKLKIDITVATLKRGYLFGRDDVRGSLIPFIEEEKGMVLESIAHDPETVLRHRRERKVVIDHPEGINHLGWPTLLLLLAKGESLESPEAVNILIETFFKHVKKGKKGALQILKDVFDNHGSPLKEVKSRYYLMALLALIGKCTDKELQYFAKECANDKESPEARFLHFCASSINNRTRKGHLLSLATLLKMSAWFVPDGECWIHFISNLDKLASIEKDLPYFFKESNLKRVAFERLVEEDFPTFFNQKRALDALFDSLSDEELCKWLPERLSSELQQDPKVAFETAKKYSHLLTLEEKWRLLKGVSPERASLTLEFLDQEHESSPATFQNFFNGLQEPLKIAIVKCKIAKIRAVTEAQKLLPILEMSRLDSCNEEFIHAIASFPENIKIELSLRLYPSLTEETQKKVLAELINLFSNTSIKTIPSESKKPLEKIWFHIWKAIPSNSQNSFIDKLKKWKVPLKINGATLFNGGLPQLEYLSKNVFMDEPARKNLVRARILQAEAEHDFVLSKKLYLQNPLHIEEESDLSEFYAKAKEASPLKALLYLRLKEPPLEDLLTCAKSALSDKDFGTLLSLTRKGLEIGKFEEALLSDYLQIDNHFEEKAALLSDFPKYITSTRLKAIHLDLLVKETASRLFSAILSSVEPSENRFSLRTLAKKIPSARIAIHFPALIAACGTQKDEILFWAEKPTLTEWLSIGKKRALETLPLIKDLSRLEPVQLALFIQIATQESLKEAIITLSKKEPHLLYPFVQPLFEKMALLNIPLKEVAAPLDKIVLQLISSPTQKIVLNNCKELISKNRSVEYLNLYIKLSNTTAASETDLSHIKLRINELLSDSSSPEILTLSFTLLPKPLLQDTVATILKKLTVSDSSEKEWTHFLQEMWDLHQDAGKTISISLIFMMFYANLKRSPEDPVVMRVVTSFSSYITESVLTWERLQKVLALIDIIHVPLRVDWLKFALKCASNLVGSTTKENPTIIENCLKQLTSQISENQDIYAADFLSLFEKLCDSLNEVTKSAVPATYHHFSCLITGAYFLIQCTLPEKSRALQWRLLSATALTLCEHLNHFDPPIQQKAAQFLLYFIKYDGKLDEMQTKNHRGLCELIFDNLLAATWYPQKAIDFLEICWISRLPCRKKEGLTFMNSILENRMGYNVSSKETLFEDSLVHVLSRLLNNGTEAAKKLSLELFEFIIKQREPLLEKALIAAVKLTGTIVAQPSPDSPEAMFSSSASLSARGSGLVVEETASQANSPSHKIELPDLFQAILLEELDARIKTATTESADLIPKLLGLYGSFCLDWIEYKKKDYSSQIGDYFFKAMRYNLYSGDRKSFFYFHLDDFSNLLLGENDLAASQMALDPIGLILASFYKSDIKTAKEKELHQYWTKAWIYKLELHYICGIKKASMNNSTELLKEVRINQAQKRGFIDVSFTHQYLLANPSVMQFLS